MFSGNLLGFPGILKDYPPSKHPITSLALESCELARLICIYLKLPKPFPTFLGWPHKFFLDMYSWDGIFCLLTLFQVLLHQSFLYRFCHDILSCVRCSCLLAYFTLLLDCSICPDNEAPNRTHDQIQIYSFQHGEAGEIRIFLIIFVHLATTFRSNFVYVVSYCCHRI